MSPRELTLTVRGATSPASQSGSRREPSTKKFSLTKIFRPWRNLREIIDAYNSSGCINQNIYLNHPGVWTFKPGTRYAGQKTLTEPFINNYQKFNSNTGCVIGGDSWSEVMQSLSHFSYHNSGGQMVLCDLQGGIRSGRRGAVLTDPVILSRRRTYGVTDLGPEGISTFFARHQCNHYCKEHWQKPRNTTVYFKSWGQACRCLGQPARRRSRTNQRFMRIAIMALTKVACGQIERPGRSGGTSEVVVTQLPKA
eukprot:jgi/Botrbrau1/13050/Bobra.0187s0012.1